RWTDAPPTFLCSGCPRRKRANPTLPCHQLMEHIPGADVTEVQVRREMTTHIGFQQVPLFRITRQTLGKERLQRRGPRGGTASSIDRRHGVVDRQCREWPHSGNEVERWRNRPTNADVGRHCRLWMSWQRVERVRQRGNRERL